MLEGCDLGHRVVVRHRTPAGITDLLGVLTDLDAQRLVVRTEDGRSHTIDRGAVVAGKSVPPRPPKYSEMIALERIADRAWPAPQVRRLGDWLLRSAQGWTNRANSALPLGDADRPLVEAVAEARRWYEDQELPPKITVPLPVRRDVADHLLAADWVAQPQVAVQTAPLAAVRAHVRAAVAQATPDGRVELYERPTERFRALVAARKHGLPAAAEHVLQAEPAPLRLAEVSNEKGQVLAILRGVVIEDWLHIGLVEVIPAARRRGLARRLTAAIVDWAASEGATRVLLQVEEHNSLAMALYAGLGFTTHHRYVTFHLRAGVSD